MSTELRERIVYRINLLANDNERSEPQRVSPLRIARACFSCDNQEPTLRFFCCACRHAVCSECAEASPDRCPLCEKPPKYVRLFEDEQNPLKCDICLCPEPVQRAIFRKCGHTACGACAQKIVVQALDRSTKPLCPFCRVHCWPWPIKEHVIRPEG